MASIRLSIADKMIATDFLCPHYRVGVALRHMNRVAHFNADKPASYWFFLMRKLRRAAQRKICEREHVPETIEQLQKRLSTHTDLKRYGQAGVSESTNPQKSILTFLLITLCLTNLSKAGPDNWNLAV